MSGFVALAAAVEAVVPLVCDSTALTTAVVPLWVQRQYREGERQYRLWGQAVVPLAKR